MNSLINLIIEENNVVLISNNVIKKDIIKKISTMKKLADITYKSFNEVVDDIVGSYSLEARLMLSKTENITSELANIKLKNSLLINDQFENQKIKQLSYIKETYKKYIDKNPLSLNSYKNKTIIVVNDYKTNDLFNSSIKKISKHTKVLDVNTTVNYDKELKIFQFNNIKSEVLALVKEVAKLLEKEVNPANIRIHTLVNDYNSYLREVFNLSNIDIDPIESFSLYEYELTKHLLKLLKAYSNEEVEVGFKKVIKEIQRSVKGQNPILSSIVRVLNTYIEFPLLVRDIYDDLIYTLKHTKSTTVNYDNVIKISNLIDDLISEEDFVFILGFNQDLFPRTSMDDQYLLDFEREQLGLVTSKLKNKQEKLKCMNLISTCKNLYISYPIFIKTQKTPVSSLINQLKIKYQVTSAIYDNNYLISYSKDLDLLSLGKKLDLFYKYDLKSEQLFNLYNNYSDNLYRKYSHKFTGIDEEFLDNFLKKDLLLSYTSIDQFYKCGFLYYIEKVLKIRRSTNEDALYIGNLFHDCLNQLLLEESIDDIDSFLDKTIKDFLDKNKKVPNKKEIFFINKYKDVLNKLYINIKKQTNNSEFEIFGLEKEFTINLDKKYKVTINGKIDKVLVLTIDGEKYAIVLDYKSGNTDIDLNRIIHGLNMQIMFYFYFLNKFSNEKYHFGGGYLQKVLPNSNFSYDSKLSYDQQFENHFKLIGYSNKNHNILRKIDANFDGDDHFIYGIRMKSDGSFYAYSLQRLMTKEIFEKLLDIVEQKINQAIEDIFCGKFDINPKKLGNFDSCSYCPYLDICYRDIQDYQELDQYKNFDFIGEDL